MTELTAAILACIAFLALLALFIALRGRRDRGLTSRLDALIHDNERLERELRAAVDTSSGQMRLETSARLSELQTSLVQQMTGLTGLQGQQLADLTHRIQLGLSDVRGYVAISVDDPATGQRTQARPDARDGRREAAIDARGAAE